LGFICKNVNEYHITLKKLAELKCSGTELILNTLRKGKLMETKLKIIFGENMELLEKECETFFREVRPREQEIHTHTAILQHGTKLVILNFYKL
jgi:hypothetical protein